MAYLILVRPKDTVPKFYKGMRFRTRRDVPVRGIVNFRAPCTGGFEGTLPAGEILILEHEPPDFAKGMPLIPARYKDFEHLFVSERDRNDPTYNGYAVVWSFDRVDSDLELV